MRMQKARSKPLNMEELEMDMEEATAGWGGKETVTVRFMGLSSRGGVRARRF